MSIGGIIVMKRIAIVYYSRTGHTRKAANIIREGLMDNGIEADLKEIEVEGKVGFWRTGKMATVNDVPLLNEDYDLSEYDLVLIGSPIWAGGPAMPCLAYLDKVEDKGQNTIALLMTGGARNMNSNKKSMGKMVKQLSEMGYGDPIATLNLRYRRGKMIEGEEAIPGFLQDIVEVG
jgi:flavodoxin